MAQTEQKFRLELMVFLFLFFTCAYTLEGIFILAEEDYNMANLENVTQNPEEYYTPDNYTHTPEVMKTPLDPVSIVIGFFGFLMFAPLGLPQWAMVITTTVISTVWITLIYLVYTLIRDWVPFV